MSLQPYCVQALLSPTTWRPWQVLLALLAGCEFLLLVQDACYNKTRTFEPPPLPSRRLSGVLAGLSARLPPSLMATSKRLGSVRRSLASRKSERLREVSFREPGRATEMATGEARNA